MVEIEVCDWCGRGVEDDITVFWSHRLRSQIKEASGIDESRLHYCSIKCMKAFIENRGVGKATCRKGDVLIMVNGDEVEDKDLRLTKKELIKAMLEAKRKDRLWKEKEKQLGENGYGAK